ncbi:outer membrane protein [Sandaracinobacter neustonicus]|nr:outer membrane beta-barrel protein [Sandaracinobacter neustonicus]
MARATKIALAIAGASALFVGTQASAAEPFNGPYVGVQGGWQHDNNRFTLRGGEGGTTSDRMSGSSFAYGAQLGYDHKLNDQFVLGAEAFLTGDTNKVRSGDATFDGGRALGLLARAGVLAGPRTLIYAKGGWENGRFSYAVDGIGVSTNRDGWSLGGGVEQAITDAISARVEYRHTKFNSFSSSALDNALDVDSAQARVNRDRVMVGVNYRF